MSTFSNSEGQASVLIVDDVQANLVVLQMLLQRAGYQVYAAENGKLAMETLRQESVQLIISDILMPVMDGYELCRQCKLDEALSCIPFIFYTATYTGEDDRAFGLSLGAARFIIKPAEHKALLSEIAEVLGEARERTIPTGVESPQLSETVYERGHNIRLVHKLEQKVEQLERERRALKQSEAKYRTLFDASSDGIMLLDEDGFIDCNRAAMQMFGCVARDAFLGKHPAALSPPKQAGGRDSQQLADEHINTAFVHGSDRFEWLHRRADGSLFPADIWLTAMKLDGKPVLQAIARDISQQKQHEDQLRKLSCCVEQSGEAMLITDRQGNIEYVNPSFTRLTGYQESEVLGKKPNILNSGKQGADFYSEMWQTITAGKSWQGKVIDRRKDGSFYPSFLTISPIHDQSDSPDTFTHFVGVQSDLTQIEEAEARFQQAQKMEAIGTLVGGIAHDFNNILAGITGNIYLAKDEAHELPEAVQMLDNADVLAFRAAEMIGQLLTFSRKSTVDMQAMPLTSFLKESMKLLSVSVPENIGVELHICDDELTIYGDSTQIHQMLMNLVNNGRDAIEGVDNPLISICLESFDADEAFVRQRPWHINARHFAHICVSDNGCGVPGDQIEHLFEPFFTTKEQGKGTGLGLAMVYGAVKGHQGFVEVESEPGQGTSFHIYLPKLETPAVADTVVSGEAMQGKSECILLVDDDQSILEISSDVLISLGYRVLTASNGQEAVDLFKAQPDSIDLVLLDVVMPVMGGVAAYKRMREIKPDIKVMFCTGYDKEQSLTGNLDIANADILSKPFSIAAMSQSIRNKLDT